jgi:large subunit ribosomal protein L15
MIKVHELAPAPGSNRGKRRVGRGIGGKGGKTAGRGTKGQGARDTIPAGFEGGQLPLTQRLPKLKGFHNPFRVSYSVVNLSSVQNLAEGGTVVIDPTILLAKGQVHKGEPVKILGNGSLTIPVTVSAHAFSEAAKQAIVASGGTVVVLDAPNGGRRVPAKGNALTNR